MDPWENVRNKIKDMQASFLVPGAANPALPDETPVLDYWKKRYDEERKSWEDKLAAKEAEQARIREKFSQDEKTRAALEARLKELEERIAGEKALLDDRHRLQGIENELTVQKAAWEGRARALEEENERLKMKMRLGEEMKETDFTRLKETEAEKIRLEVEAKSLRAAVEDLAREKETSLKALEQERQTLRKELDGVRASRTLDDEKDARLEKELALLREEKDQRLALLARREKEQMQAFENLAKGFAHKAHNNLGVIGGTADLCAAHFEMDEELKKQIQDIGRNARELTQAVEEFIGLTQVPPLKWERLDVQETLSGVLNGLEDAFKKRNVFLKKKWRDDLPRIEGDKKILAQGLRELILNAIEASPEGSAVAVETGQDGLSGQVVIKIADSGQGLPEPLLQKALLPYYTTRKGKKGLGLSLAKRAVDLHRGSLSIAGPAGQGARVTVQIPAAKNSPA